MSNLNIKNLTNNQVAEIVQFLLNNGINDFSITSGKGSNNSSNYDDRGCSGSNNSSSEDDRGCGGSRNKQEHNSFFDSRG